LLSIQRLLEVERWVNFNKQVNSALGRRAMILNILVAGGSLGNHPPNDSTKFSSNPPSARYYRAGSARLLAGGNHIADNISQHRRDKISPAKEQFNEEEAVFWRKSMIFNSRRPAPLCDCSYRSQHQLKKENFKTILLLAYKYIPLAAIILIGSSICVIQAQDSSKIRIRLSDIFIR